MGWFSHKNKESAAEAEGAYVARAEDVSGAGAGRGRGKRSDGTKLPTEPVDPVLPEKKRARRRLVGAVALVLAVIIGLPMVLDSEPKPLAGDIAIQIPSKDKPYSASDVAGPTSAVPASQSLDANEELVDDVKAVVKTGAKSENKPENKPVLKPEPENKPVLKSEPETKLETKPETKPVLKPETKSVLKPEAKPETKPVIKPPVKSEPKPETKPAVKVDAKPDAKPVSKPEPAAKPEESTQRAKAILDAGAEPANSKFVVQVAALATQEKIDELQGKLRGAGIASYTQKVATESGNRTRIRLGPFASKEEAMKVRDKLVKLGLNGTLIPQP